MEPIDYSYRVFKELKSEIGSYSNTIITEQDARMKVIDPMFVKVLGWNFSDIHNEEATGNSYIDYRLSINDLSRLIVEAKRDSRVFELSNRASGRSYKLNGPVFKNKDAIEGILQAIRYCGLKNTELACVTNGGEWIVFRGSRLGDGKNTLDGHAFIFSSLPSIEDNFKTFYELLHKSSVEKMLYRSYFQEAEGQPIRALSFKRTIRHQNSAKLISRSDISKDLDKVMAAFFRKLSGQDDLDMLAKCFVVTKESQAADEKLARISEEIVGKIRGIDTDQSEALVDIIKQVRSTERNEFILLIGTKGSGKSTFIKRFFKFVLPRHIAQDCVYLNINLADSTGDDNTVIEWLNQNLLEVIENSLFDDSAPTFDEIQGMFFDEYVRWSKGTLKYLYESSKEQFKIEFGKHIEKRREERPAEYIKRLIGSIVKARKKLPCIIFDNADHFSIEFQEKVFQYARSIYEQELCLMIIPITDKTSWQLSQQGALQSFDNESLFLPTPPPMIIFERRIKYIEGKINEEKSKKGQGYFFEKGIRLSLKDLNAFAHCLQRIFIETGNASKWLGNLSNFDIRRCLRISRDITTSSYIRIDELFKTYIAGNTYFIQEYFIKRAIIKKNYDIYPIGQHEFVQNVYCLSSDIPTSPLLGIRILRLLWDAKRSDNDGYSSFVSVDQIVDYFHAMTIDRRAVTICLDSMIKSGLCFSYDPTKKSIEDTNKLEISPAGKQHFFWGTNDTTYLGTMLDSTPIIDKETFDSIIGFRDQNRSKMWSGKVKLFIEYLLNEDSTFVQIPEHQAYSGQNTIGKYLFRLKTKL